MKKAMSLRIRLVSTFFIFGMAIFPTHTIAASVEGNTYRVSITRADGFRFTDCFRFDIVGNLVVDGLGQILTFAHDGLNRKRSLWQATSRSGARIGIGFHGKTQGAKLRGDGIRDDRITFRLSGKKDSACSISIGAATLSPVQNPYESP